MYMYVSIWKWVCRALLHTKHSYSENTGFIIAEQIHSHVLDHSGTNAEACSWRHISGKHVADGVVGGKGFTPADHLCWGPRVEGHCLVTRAEQEHRRLHICQSQD